MISAVYNDELRSIARRIRFTGLSYEQWLVGAENLQLFGVSMNWDAADWIVCCQLATVNARTTKH